MNAASYGCIHGVCGTLGSARVRNRDASTFMLILMKSLEMIRELSPDAQCKVEEFVKSPRYLVFAAGKRISRPASDFHTRERNSADSTRISHPANEFRGWCRVFALGK